MNQYELLLQEMSECDDFSEDKEEILEELLYSATENGIIDGCSVSEAVRIYKLVTLAIKFDSLPNNLRM